MKVLFLDQSGKLGGAELSLLDVASAFSPNCLVGLFQSGPFLSALEGRGIPAQVLTQGQIPIHKDSRWSDISKGLGQLGPLVTTIADLGREYDLIYTNTSKALMLGALASLLCGKPLVHHLRDIVSKEHFSSANRTLLVAAANWSATHVIANSIATQLAFIKAGGNANKVSVVYNGFEPDVYQVPPADADHIRLSLNIENQFVIGHFSRLSPWKGQHILLEALQHCSKEIVVLLVGEALFGEDTYVEKLHRKIEHLDLGHRVKLLGFRADVPQIMAACDVITHTSIAPEPFGRVIVEAMLCGKPVIAAQAGGAVELIEHGYTGWLSPPGNAQKLAEIITIAYTESELSASIARRGQHHASKHFNLETTNQKIKHLLTKNLG